MTLCSMYVPDRYDRLPLAEKVMVLEEERKEDTWKLEKLQINVLRSR